MENKTNFIAAGIFVLSLFVGAIFFVAWIGKSEISNHGRMYLTYFKGSVSGLKTGAQVLYNGVPVGSVIDISIDSKNVERVKVSLNIKKAVPIKEDAVTSLEMQGLTGLAFIQITGGTQEKGLLKKHPNEKFPVITSKPSKLEDIFNAVPDLLRNLNQLLGQENQRLITKMLENVTDLTMGLSSQTNTIVNAIDHFNMSLESFNSLTKELMLIIKNNKAPIDQFFTEGLFELTQLLSQMRGTFESISSLISNIEKASLPLLTNREKDRYDIQKFY